MEGSPRVSTPRQRKVRRRADGSPVIARNPDHPVKILYLIRHGRSKGQDAKKNGLDRKTDPSLRDCGLSSLGLVQARAVASNLDDAALKSIQLVISSPLTRALHTAILGFIDKDVLVHYDLREIGSKIPENNPRPMEEVLKEIGIDSNVRNGALDYVSMRPKDWPRDYSPLVVKKDRIRNVLKWIYNERPEECLAVVCHYNVIRSALVDSVDVRPKNGIPIKCHLFSNGDLEVAVS